MNSLITKKTDMEALAEFEESLWSKPRLRYLFFELTDKCNLSCAHCGSNCTGGNNTFLEGEAIRKTLREVSEEYNPKEIMICLTGGEPLLHPECFSFVKESHTLGFPVGITSNGTLIDRTAAECLRRAGLDTISISIDGIGGVHDKFRGYRGCFDRALFGIDCLKKAGIEPEVLTVVHKGNIGQLESLFRLLKSLNIYSWRLVNIEPIGRALSQKELLLDVDDMKELLNFIHQKRYDSDVSMEVTYGCSHFLNFNYEHEVRDYYFQCGAGTMVASVMANGDIGACLDIERRPELVQGNIYKDDFVDVWENRFDVFRRDRTIKSPKCTVCEYKKICKGDSLHTWDFDRNEPRYCLAASL